MSKKNFLFVVFLIFSLLVWTFAKLTSSYQDWIQINLVLTNPPAGAKIISPEAPQQVDVFVKASGFTFIKNKIRTKQVSIDLTANGRTEGNNRIFVDKKNIMEAVSAGLSKSTAVLQIETSPIEVLLTHINKRKLPLTLKNISTLPKGYIFTKKPILYPDSVFVTGPSQVLDTLRYLEINVANWMYYAKDTIKKVSLPTMKNRNIRFDTKEVYLSASIDPLILLTKQVKITSKSVPDSLVLKLLQDSVTVQYAVPKSVAALAKSFEPDIFVDISDIGLYQNELPLRVQTKPDWLYNFNLSLRSMPYYLFKK
ncbi:MAG: YbbR-like domain-containing protein [Flavobacteriaceae bacterium]|nr:YbbR-like domain-containing protein [Flavobacteriaceae bacterium]